MDAGIDEFRGRCDGRTHRTTRRMCDDEFIDRVSVPHDDVRPGSVHDDTHVGRRVPLPHLYDGIFDDCVFGVDGGDGTFHVEVPPDGDIILYVRVPQNGENVCTILIHVELCPDV